MTGQIVVMVMGRMSVPLWYYPVSHHRIESKINKQNKLKFKRSYMALVAVTQSRKAVRVVCCVW
jgi:hypothetical protein